MRISRNFAAAAAFLLVAAYCQHVGAQEEVEGWGTVTDPVGDCEFTVEDGRLEFHVPGGLHDLWPGGGVVNAARVMQPLGSGDFTVTVEVSGTILPEPDKPADRIVFQSGTLLVWLDEDNFVRIDRACNPYEGNARHFVFYHLFEDGERVMRQTETCPNRPTLLRIRGRDGQLEGGYSQDGGETWTTWQDGTYDPDADWQVGVCAINTTTEPFTAYLENLRIGDEVEGELATQAAEGESAEAESTPPPANNNRPNQSNGGNRPK